MTHHLITTRTILLDDIIEIIDHMTTLTIGLIIHRTMGIGNAMGIPITGVIDMSHMTDNTITVIGLADIIGGILGIKSITISKY
jgi:hypothetical protein